MALQIRNVEISPNGVLYSRVALVSRKVGKSWYKILPLYFRQCYQRFVHDCFDVMENCLISSRYISCFQFHRILNAEMVIFSWQDWILILWLAFYCWKKLFSKDIETVWRKMQWFFQVLSAQCKPSIKKGILNQLPGKISRIRIMQCCQLYEFVLPMSATLNLPETLNELQKKPIQHLPTFERNTGF